MVNVRTSLRFERLFPAVLLALALAGCQLPQSGSTNKDFQALPGGSFENVGAVIEEPGVFRIIGGQTFQTPFSLDCTKLTADVGGWKDALVAGAHKVAISLPGQQRTYGGVLALCTIHKSATGPSSRSYQLVIPASKIPDASDGLIASVAEQVSVNRQVMLDLNQLLAHQPGDPYMNTITDDFAWMLWFTDRPEAMGVAFSVSSGVAPAPVASAPAAQHSAPTPMPTLKNGATYTAVAPVNVRAGPSTSSAVVTLLKAGDAVVAAGEAKNGFWSVTTVAGQSGWVYASNLKAN